MLNRSRTTTAWLLALAAAFTLAGLWFKSREEAAREEEIEPAAVVSEVLAQDLVLGESETNAAREEIAAPAPTTSGTSKPAPDATQTAGTRVHGRVVDLTGQGVADLEITDREAPLVVFARSRGDGSFDFAAAPTGSVFVASSSTFTTVRALSLVYSSQQDGLIVVAPAVAISGVVVDEDGLGLAGARVTSVAGDNLFARFPLALDALVPVDPLSVVSDAGGFFDLPLAISAEGVELRASLAGFADASLPAPVSARSDLRFVLKKGAPRTRALTGVVVRRGGEPAASARVYLGDAVVPTDEHGAFRLELPPWIHEDQALVAIESGSQAATISGMGRIVRAASTDPAPVRMQLGPPPLSIRGRVVDARGAPLPDWSVALMRGTAVTRGRIPMITAEALTAGGEPVARTDARGAFRLDGLLERDYELCAYDAVSLARIESQPIAAGTENVELVLAADALMPKVLGRVVARDGTPVAGASVSVGLVTGRDEGATAWISGKQSSTRPDGTFELSNVPRRFVHFDVGGDAVIPLSFQLEGIDLGRPVVIEVARRCHFRIEGLPISGDARHLPNSTDAANVVSLDARSLRAQDAQGDALQLMVFQGGGWMSSSSIPVTADTTRVYAVSEAAVDIVLQDAEGVASEKRPLRLVPGAVTLVKW